MLAPLPSIVLVITRAPAAAASSGVPSIDPSSTTITSSTSVLRFANSTTAAIVAASLSTGMMTETPPVSGRSFHRQFGPADIGAASSSYELSIAYIYQALMKLS